MYFQFKLSFAVLVLEASSEWVDLVSFGFANICSYIMNFFSWLKANVTFSDTLCNNFSNDTYDSWYFMRYSSQGTVFIGVGQKTTWPESPQLPELLRKLFSRYYSWQCVEGWLEYTSTKYIRKSVAICTPSNHPGCCFSMWRWSPRAMPSYNLSLLAQKTTTSCIPTKTPKKETKECLQIIIKSISNTCQILCTIFHPIDCSNPLGPNDPSRTSASVSI